MKHYSLLRPCHPVPCYTEDKRAYIMDDFGNAVYVDPKTNLMSQWTHALVTMLTLEH